MLVALFNFLIIASRIHGLVSPNPCLTSETKAKSRGQCKSFIRRLADGGSACSFAEWSFVDGEKKLTQENAVIILIRAQICRPFRSIRSKLRTRTHSLHSSEFRLTWTLPDRTEERKHIHTVGSNKGSNNWEVVERRMRFAIETNST
jgi:hypothetical protein